MSLPESERANVIKCGRCGILNFSGELACKRCGCALHEEEPTTPYYPPSRDVLASLDGKIAVGMTPLLPSWSLNGFGLSLLFHRSVGDGLYEATQWLTLLFVPVVPLSTWVIQPGVVRRSEYTPMGTSASFRILGKRPFNLIRILRMYAITLLCVLFCFGPFAIVYLVVSKPARGAGDSWGFALFLVSLGWALLGKIIIDRYSVDPYTPE